MMKKMFTALLLSAGIMTAATAQTTFPYDFSYSTQPYAELTGQTTLILGSNGWDDTTVAFTLPIEFEYQGIPITTWSMDTYGGLYPNDMDLGIEAPFIYGINTDYMDNQGATISYQVSGNTGSRIAKVEYKNVGFYSGDDTENANFQIWLYEGTNKIEYHVGPSHVNAATFDYMDEGEILSVGLMFDADVLDSVMIQTVKLNNGTHKDTALVLDPSDPGTIDIIGLLVYGTTYPVNGSVFGFTPPADGTAITKLPKQLNGLYPNPANDKITLQLKARPAANATVTVYAITGNKVLQQDIHELQTELNIAALRKGVYILKYTAGGHSESYRIIKK